jgi:glutaredoxin
MKNLILVTTQSCPKCPKFKELVKKKFGEENIEFIDNTDSRFGEVIEQYKLMSAPTLVVNNYPTEGEFTLVTEPEVIDLIEI